MSVYKTERTAVMVGYKFSQWQQDSEKRGGGEQKETK